MAKTVTFGKLETQIRGEFLNDTDSEQYRWSPATVLAYINEALNDITLRLNTWALYDQDTGVRSASADVAEAAALNEQSTDADIASVRAKTLTIDDRWRMAVAYLAAAKCYLVDNDDTINLQKAATLEAKGKEYALS